MNKFELKKKAEEHNKTMLKMFEEEINTSIKNSKVFDTIQEVSKGSPTFEVFKGTTTDAICKFKGKKVALNFASYKYPGGGFLNGSRAQEEALCHDSFLYNVLSNIQDFYEYNKSHTNRGLYTNRAILSPDIIFKNRFLCDILTCAAPNRSVRLTYNNFTEEDNRKALESRIEFICSIVSNYDLVIFGAFGCGIFKQDSATVAKLFKKYAVNGRIIFAIPDNTTYLIFKNVFS